MKRSLSLNDISKIQFNIFTQYPPPSYGELVRHKHYSSKKMRQYFIRKFYKYIKY
jgi:hypothetical protein